MHKPSNNAVSHAPVPISECALAKAIHTIGDAWSLLILREVLCGVERFDQIREDIGITRSVLADRLARLVSEGVIEHYAYRDPGQRTRKAYVLTTKGRALLPALVALREWAGEHLENNESPLRLQVRNGQRVSTRLVCEDGLEVNDLTEIIATRNAE